MANFNAVMVMGRLVNDPELKYTSTGIPVCHMTVATNKKVKKVDGTSSESTVFIDVSAWRRMAEICTQFLKKGREVFVSGELVQSKWVDPQGQKRSKIKITAHTVQFLGVPKKGSEEDGKSEEREEEVEAAE